MKLQQFSKKTTQRTKSPFLRVKHQTLNFSFSSFQKSCRFVEYRFHLRLNLVDCIALGQRTDLLEITTSTQKTEKQTNFLTSTSSRAYAMLFCWLSSLAFSLVLDTHSTHRAMNRWNDPLFLSLTIASISSTTLQGAGTRSALQ
jgi:hypothetical protein